MLRVTALLAARMRCRSSTAARRSTTSEVGTDSIRGLRRPSPLVTPTVSAICVTTRQDPSCGGPWRQTKGDREVPNELKVRRGDIRRRRLLRRNLLALQIGGGPCRRSAGKLMMKPPQQIPQQQWTKSGASLGIFASDVASMTSVVDVVRGRRVYVLKYYRPFLELESALKEATRPTDRGRARRRFVGQVALLQE